MRMQPPARGTWGWEPPESRVAAAALPRRAKAGGANPAEADDPKELRISETRLRGMSVAATGRLVGSSWPLNGEGAPRCCGGAAASEGDAGAAGTLGRGNMARFPMKFILRMMTETPDTARHRMPVAEQSIVVERSMAPAMVTLPLNACEALIRTLQFAGSSLPLKVLAGSEIDPACALSTKLCTDWAAINGGVNSKSAHTNTRLKDNCMVGMQSERTAT